MTSETTIDSATDVESPADAEGRESEGKGRPQRLVPLTPAECAQVSGGACATDSPLY